MTPSPRTPVSLWLLACMALVAAMVMLGGYTRLSGSGLSITEWKPIHGVIPPLGEAQWQEEFDQYRATPQYEKVNKGMTLDEFKSIFWPEYLHRLLGRAIGMVFLLPLIYFAARKHISSTLTLKLLAIFALGGAQGFMGWYMVKSGLVNTPYVSHLRLAAHLALAFAIFGLLLWQWLNLFFPSPRGGEGQGGGASARTSAQIAPPPDFLSSKAAKKTDLLPTGRGEYNWLLLTFTLLCLQILYGAFMAGLHAGLIYNTYPLMDGHIIPPEAFALSPWWLNLFEDIPTVQFIHRWLAITVVIVFFTGWRRYRGMKRLTAIGHAMLFQVALGIATLLLQAPLWLAWLHQLTALILFAFLIAALHANRTMARNFLSVDPDQTT